MAHASTASIASGDIAPPPYAIAELERIVAPDTATFERRYLRPSRPVILSGLTDAWLPPEEWTLARVAERWGAATVVAAVLANGTLMDDPENGVVFRRIPLRDFIRSLDGKGPASHYVMAPTWNLPATFQESHRIPPYCAGARHLQAKFWVGKSGTVTPMHRDVPHNLHVHLSGRKRWLLFPPGSKGMYPRGLLSGMPNFSAVDPERPDYQRHPAFRSVPAFGATLAPGETLLIPHGWWHHTRSLDDAVAMNFWWGGSVVRLIAFASATFKRLRGIRRDEWG